MHQRVPPANEPEHHSRCTSQYQFAEADRLAQPGKSACALGCPMWRGTGTGASPVLGATSLLSTRRELRREDRLARAVSAVDCPIPSSGATTVASQSGGEVGRGSGGRVRACRHPCLFDLCMVNCQTAGTLNESSANGPGIAGFGRAYRRGSNW